MKAKLKQLFLNEKFIILVILLNCLIIFLQESGYNSLAINVADVLCTTIFVIEMMVKMAEYGFRGYWKDAWNRLDGILVILSIPSVIALFVPTNILIEQLGVLLALRLLRILRFFRIMRIFPNFATIMRNFAIAVKQCSGVFFGFLVVIIILSLISCELFRQDSPEYFGNPIDSIYSIFRICTGEGWNEIPDSIAIESSLWTARAVKLYFSIVLILCSIVGLSLVNSIFVDAMVSDNDEDIKAKLDEIEKKINQLTEKQS